MTETYIETALQKFNVTDAAIESMKKDFGSLTINGLDDKEGYGKVREARITVKNKRIEVEKKRKELKEDSIKFGKAVDAEAKRITGLLEPIENYLETQEKAVDDELERIKQEKIEATRKKLSDRCNALAVYGPIGDVSVLSVMPDEDFDKLLSEKKQAHEAAQQELAVKAEQERQAAEKLAAEQKAEADRLAIVAKEQAEKEAQLKKMQEEIEAKKAAIEKAETVTQTNLPPVAEGPVLHHIVTIPVDTRPKSEEGTLLSNGLPTFSPQAEEPASFSLLKLVAAAKGLMSKYITTIADETGSWDGNQESELVALIEQLKIADQYMKSRFR